MPSAYSATVATDTLLDAAVIKIGSTPIGVTRGGTRRIPGKEIRVVDFDGRRAAHVVGLDRVVGFADRIEATILEFAQGSLDRLQNVSGGAPAVPRAGEIFTTARYLTDVRITYARSGGGVVEEVYPKALVQWGEFVGEDKNEVVAPISIEAVQNLAIQNTDDAPYYIVHAPSGGGISNVVETFTRSGSLGGSAADSGHLWTDHAGPWTTNGAEALKGATDFNGYATVDSLRADATITLIVSQYLAGELIGGTFRYTDLSNNFRAVVSNTNFYVQKVVAGVTTTILTGAHGAITPPLTLEIVLAADLITFKSAGGTLGSVSEVFNQSVTRHGLQVSGGSGSSRLTSFTVTA